MSIARLIELVPPLMRPFVELQASTLAPDERAELDAKIGPAFDAAQRGDYAPALELARAHGISEAMIRGFFGVGGPQDSAG